MIYDKLYNWQKGIINKYKDRKSFGLFLEMGTGKTPISLGLAEANKCTKIVIITINPKTLETEDTKGSWLYWASQMEMKYNYKTKKDLTFDKNENELLIINYESLYQRGNDKKGKAPLKEFIVNFILSCKNHNVAIIIDESHKLKNLSSNQTVASSNLIKRLRLYTNNTYTYLLTGTPFTTGYIDLYSQLKLLECPMTKTEFIDNYCIRGHLPSLLEWQQPIIGYRNIDDLYKLIHKYAITVKSEEVCDLPEQIFIDHISDESESFKMLTNESVRGHDIICYAKERKITVDKSLYIKDTKVNNPFYRNLAYPQDKWISETVGSFWMRCRQGSIGFQGNDEDSEWFDKSRLKQLKEFLSDYRDNYVLFYNYVPELLELYSLCEELGYNIDVYCGDVKSLIFYEKYSNMSDSEKLINKNNIIISNFASGSTGMNWQEYNKCIIFSLPVYKDYAQGIKRIHRTGQKNTVYYHIFYQDNFLDRDMKKSLEERVDYTEKIFEQKVQDKSLLKYYN